MPTEPEKARAIEKRARSTFSVPSLARWMALAIVVVAGLAYWDEERESAAALDDFAHEQAIVARSVSAALASRLATMKRDARSLAMDLAAGHMRSNFDAPRGLRVAIVGRDEPSVLPAIDDGSVLTTSFALNEHERIELEVPSRELLANITPLEAPGALVIVTQRPNRLGLLTTAGTLVRARRIEASLEAGESSIRLSRQEAADLGLPARMAMAGLSTVDLDELGRWGIAVVATAQRERDRELRAKVRLVLGVVVASGLVLAFGGFALRKQRTQLELVHDLALREAERVRDERLVRADKLATMGALATGVAHEVSTPLGVILGRAEQLLPGVAQDPRAKRAVEAILEQAERIGRIIRGFLSLARGDAPPLERIDPASIARAATGLVEHRFVKAGVKLASDVAPNLPKIACEPRLFEQVIVNLLLNACDACSPGGSVELRVRSEGARVAFVVTDDGVGIPAEEAARATEPFFTTKAPGAGSGLGLAIATEIVKHHHGTLTLAPRNEGGTDAPARGTRARVDVPVSPETIDV